MFDNDPEVIFHFVFKEKKRLFDYVYPEIELIFIELQKFNKQLDELETLTDKVDLFYEKCSHLGNSAVHNGNCLGNTASLCNCQ
jgi:hypothetical protein